MSRQRKVKAKKLQGKRIQKLAEYECLCLVELVMLCHAALLVTEG